MLATCCQQTFHDAHCYLLLVQTPIYWPPCVLLYFDSVTPHPSHWDPRLHSDNNLLRKRDRPDQHAKRKWGEFICLPHDLKSPSKANNRICSIAFRPMLFRHYVYLHCSQLRLFKSRLNTVLSYHAILASVSIAEWVQIWSRAMEMSDNRCSIFCFSHLILFLPTIYINSKSALWSMKILIPLPPNYKKTLSYLPLVVSSHADSLGFLPLL